MCYEWYSWKTVSEKAKKGEETKPVMERKPAPAQTTPSKPADGTRKPERVVPELDPV
jgi:hypothetical protein